MSVALEHAHDIKIRKPRPCDWCGEAMSGGDPATTWVGIFDEPVPLRVTVHPECVEMVDEFGDLFDQYLGDRGTPTPSPINSK